VALDTPRHTPELARQRPLMSPLPRPKPSPGVLVRALVSLGAVWAVAAALAAYAAGRAVPGPGFGAEFATLVVIGALARRYGVALPGNGFSSYILGVTAFAVLDRGWACAVLVGPTAMVAGDLMLRRLPPRAALVNAASVGLALAWLRLSHAGLAPLETLVVGAALAAATATSVYVIRLGVRADELALIQGLSQVIARDISLAKSFGRIQELTRRL